MERGFDPVIGEFDPVIESVLSGSPFASASRTS
jgi:hypothetical protein